MTQTADKPQGEKPVEITAPRPKLATNLIERLEKTAEFALKLVFSNEAEIKYREWMPGNQIKYAIWKNKKPYPNSLKVEFSISPNQDERLLIISYCDFTGINFTIKDNKIISIQSEANLNEIFKKLNEEVAGLDARQIRNIMRHVPKLDPPIKLSV